MSRTLLAVVLLYVFGVKTEHVIVVCVSLIVV